MIEPEALPTLGHLLSLLLCCCLSAYPESRVIPIKAP
jgi:hypothetical protein